MELFLDKRAVKQIRTSAQDAIDEGDSDTLREDVLEAFSDLFELLEGHMAEAGIEVKYAPADSDDEDDEPEEEDDDEDEADGDEVGFVEDEGEEL